MVKKRGEVSEMYDMPFENKFHIDKNFFLCPRQYGEIKLYQIGRVYCTERTVVPEHSHLDFFELTIVTGGAGIVVTNGVETPVSKGDIYVSFSGDFHKIISDANDPLRYDFIALQTSNAEMHRDLEDIISRFHSPESRVIVDENIPLLVSNAVAELNESATYSETVLGAVLLQIFAYVIRGFGSVKPLKHSKSVGDAEILCYQIMNYIDNHIYTMKHLAELSEVTNYNYNYLSNLYKKVTGDTLQNYFSSRRLETARLLLSQGNLNVTQISTLLNYSSIYMFSRAFKLKYGIAPTQVKRI
jgi:AraC-like DNA-binding protein/mannose-6-phosphate isomerase-like protein (cupin superfamily)